MRTDIKRIKASEVHIGDVVCFYSPDRSQDKEVITIYKRMDKKLVFNEGIYGQPVKPSDFVFIKSN
jgi:hypothetical protein